MTKEKMLNLIEKLIDNKEKSIKEYNKALLELQESPGVTNVISYILSDEIRHLSQLNELKLKIENYDSEKVKAEKLFRPYQESLPENYYEAIVFTEEKEGE